MTKVGQLFEEEKQEALRKLEEEKSQEIKQIKKEVKKIKKKKKEAVKEAEKQTALESSRTIARRMLEKGMDSSEVWSFIPNLSYGDIEALKECKRD